MQSGLYKKNTLFTGKHFTAVINAVCISISDPVESKSSPIRFQIAESGWIAIRKLDHVQHWYAAVKLSLLQGNDLTIYHTG